MWSGDRGRAGVVWSDGRNTRRDVAELEGIEAVDGSGRISGRQAFAGSRNGRRSEGRFESGDPVFHSLDVFLNPIVGS